MCSDDQTCNVFDLGHLNIHDAIHPCATLLLLHQHLGSCVIPHRDIDCYSVCRQIGCRNQIDKAQTDTISNEPWHYVTAEGRFCWLKWWREITSLEVRGYHLLGGTSVCLYDAILVLLHLDEPWCPLHAGWKWICCDEPAKLGEIQSIYSLCYRFKNLYSLNSILAVLNAI